MRKLWQLFVIVVKSRTLRYLAALFFALNCTSSAILAQAEQDKRIEAAVGYYGWGFTGWEINALGEKLQASIHRPATQLSELAGAKLVEDYLERAEQVGERERAINAILSQSQLEPSAEENGKIEQLQSEIDALRLQQQAVRVTVEAVIEQQITWAIDRADFDWRGYVLPPVKFTFTEPPKKLIVSPRDRITTVYGQMIDADMPLEQIERLESRLKSEQNLSGYVTGIGGLGAYPTMVVERASLYWILSTVAHEWTHNYLSFFPLGFNYGVNSEIITLNETTAEIVGNELGRVALLHFYPDQVNSEVYPDLRMKDEGQLDFPLGFNFRKAMQETREVVDKLLYFGRIADAERYMEARRILFVENGNNLRVLNQAYFAFHGSYGTSAAVSGSDPITPQVFKLRTLAGTIYGFVKAIRGVTTLKELEQVVRSLE